MHQVLIIGCGNIAGGFDFDRPGGALPLTHAGAFAQHSAFSVAACVDPDRARRAAFQSRWQIDWSASSVAELGASEGDFDVISICSPTSFHRDHIDAALALRPRLIFCEKPAAPSAAETRRLAGRCAAAGVLLAVNYTRRWAPDVLRLAAELTAGAWGKVRSAAGVYTKGVVHNGGHMADLLQLLLGPLELVAAGPPRFDFWDDDPSVPALMTSATGVPVTLNLGDAGDYALFELTLVTELGTITMIDGGQAWVFRRACKSGVFAGYRTLGGSEIVTGEYDRAMLAAVNNIAETLESGVALASDAANALAAQALCEAMRDMSLTAHPNRSIE